MRKLLTFLIALSANIVAVVSPVSAQGFNGGGFNVGLGPFASGGGCTQATNFLARVTAASLTIDSTHTTAYTNLICGLVTDGIITGSMSGAGSGSSACGAGSFDGLYIFATNTTSGTNTTLAGLNLCGTSFTITVNGTPTFTTDRGWTAGNIVNDYLDTGFNASTATSPNFTLNTAHFAVWNNTNSTDTNAAIGNGNATSLNHMYPQFSAGSFYSRLNDGTASGAYTISNPQGLLVGNRSGASAIQAYQGSTSLGAGTQAAGSGVNNATMQILRLNGGSSTTFQIGAASFGGSFSSGQVASYYGRMKTYMTAVGVCGVITCP
jgi:hypothetical protein